MSSGFLFAGFLFHGNVLYVWNSVRRESFAGMLFVENETLSCMLTYIFEGP